MKGRIEKKEKNYTDFFAFSLESVESFEISVFSTDLVSSNFWLMEPIIIPVPTKKMKRNKAIILRKFFT